MPKLEANIPKPTEDPTKSISGSSASGGTTMAFSSLSGGNLQKQLDDLSQVTTDPRYQPKVKIQSVVTPKSQKGW